MREEAQPTVTVAATDTRLAHRPSSKLSAVKSDAMTSSQRVRDLMAQMTLPEKLAQLQGLWIGAGEDGAVVAPTMDAQSGLDAQFEAFARDGLGQLTRVYGTAPVSPRDGLAHVLARQRWLADNTRWRIGTLVHEECLTGLAAWTATTFPAPIAWGATFDPELIWRMGAAIGETMDSLGINQGLAPVLDVIRDHRWGRVEECIAEDPYLIATLGKAYVEGMQAQGPLATLKHFVGYSASAAGRNLAPVHAGWREIEDIFLLPFEVGVLDAGAGSVMHAYPDIDGVPVAADARLLTGVLRDRWGFTGTLVADYFAVAFLAEVHGVADGLGDAARQALAAGIDVELPTGKAFRGPLLAELATHPETIADIDRACARVLGQKETLGLLDIDQVVANLEAKLEHVPDTLDPPAHRNVARLIAEESVIVLANDGILPLVPRHVSMDGEPAGNVSADAPPPQVLARSTSDVSPMASGTPRRIAVVGPNADRPAALFGCYSFINHVLAHHGDVPMGLDAPTILDALRAEYGNVTYAQGCPVRDQDASGFADAVAAASRSDAVIAVVGDQSGLFGAGTSGEGCDTDSLRLPGLQEELLDALFTTGTPVVVAAVTGRPYALGPIAAKAAATIQVFFPGEDGAAAVAGVLSGRVNPSGRLPVSVPTSAGAEPYSYLHANLGELGGVTSIDTKPAFAFGHGLSYTSFEYSDASISASVPTHGWIDASVRIRNAGDRDGVEVVQVYGRDVVASVAPLTVQLLAYTRVALASGEAKTITFRIPAARFAFHDRDMMRVVEPGDAEIWFGRSCQRAATSHSTVRLVGPASPVTNDTPRLATVQTRND